MNRYKKDEIALYVTFGTFLLAVGALTGDYLTYAKMLGVFAGTMGIFVLLYKSVRFILNKIYPDNEKV